MLSGFSETRSENNTADKSLISSSAVTLEDSNLDSLNRTAFVLSASNDNQGVEPDDLDLIARMQHCTQTKPYQMSFVMNNATVDFNLCSDPMASGKKYYLFSSPNNCLPFLLYWWLPYEGYFVVYPNKQPTSTSSYDTYFNLWWATTAASTATSTATISLFSWPTKFFIPRSCRLWRHDRRWEVFDGSKDK